MKGYHDENALYHSAQLVAHLLITGGVIAFCIQHTDTRPANERAFLLDKIIRTGENNNANIKPALELLTSDAITGRTRRRYSTNCAAPVRPRCCWNRLTSTAKMT